MHTPPTECRSVFLGVPCGLVCRHALTQESSLIYELAPPAFATAAPVFAAATFDRVYAHAVLGDRQPGRIFGDDPHSPDGVFRDRSYGFFRAAEPPPELPGSVVQAPAEA